MLEFCFFSSIAAIFYVYIGYPCCVFVLGKIKAILPLKNDRHRPTVSIIIAAYNEEASIAQTIENKLNLEYPRELVEIIVVSDGSTDRTHELVANYADKKVRLLIQEKRQGKTAALNYAVPHTIGEIIVFSDANSLYSQDALIKLVRNFNDETIGYVTGHMIYVGEDGTVVGDGCSAFMKYENIIRKQETKIGSIIGVDGGIDAVRKKLYMPMNTDQLPDFVLPLQVVIQGYRVVYEPEAVLKEESLKEAPDEYRMRVRVALRALWALSDMRALLLFKNNILFSWQLWSHKILRYLMFIFLIIAFVSNILLWQQHPVFKLLLVAHILFYVVAILPFVAKTNISQSRIVNFANYFLLVNLAFLHAFLNFLGGKKVVIWTPRKG